MDSIRRSRLWNIYKGNYYNPDSLYLLTTIPSSNTTYSDIDNTESDVYYQIEIIVNNPCNITKALTSIRSNIVSNNEIGLTNIESQTKITLYPNPTNNKTLLTIEGIKNNSKIMIFDIFGRIIKTYTMKPNQNQTEIDIKDLTPGTYYIKCKDTTNGFSTTNKLIVQ